MGGEAWPPQPPVADGSDALSCLGFRGHVAADPGCDSPAVLPTFHNAVSGRRSDALSCLGFRGHVAADPGCDSPADPAAAETVKQLWAVADACTPQSRVADYTQAMMDLGATVCLRKQPHCETCPLKQICTAYQQDRQEHLPSPRRRARRPHRVAFALEIHDTTNSLLLQKRPEEGLWGGLWSLPQFDAADEAAEWLENQFPGVEIREGQLQHHAFTHYDLDLQILCIRLEESRKEVLDCVWYDSQEVPDIGLTKVVTGLV